MTILDLQKRLREVGRLRMGEKRETSSGKAYPAKLDTWRLTSPHRELLEAAAAIYGGTVQEWPERAEYQLTTDSAELRIRLIPGQRLSQHYELWGSPGQNQRVQCLRRCDGEREMILDRPCVCPEAGEEREELAKKGQACRATTRLSVLMPEIPGLGAWRLESHGYYAAVELGGISAVLEELATRGILFPAILRLEHRTVVRGDTTRNFVVPAIDTTLSVNELETLMQGTPTGAHTPLDRPPGLEAAKALETTAGLAESPPATGRRAAEVIPPAETSTRPQDAVSSNDDGWTPEWDDPAAETLTAAEAASEEAASSDPPAEPGELPEHERISDAQRRKLFATLTELELTEDDLRTILTELYGGPSTKLIPRNGLDAVLDKLVQACQRKAFS